MSEKEGARESPCAADVEGQAVRAKGHRRGGKRELRGWNVKNHKRNAVQGEGIASQKTTARRSSTERPIICGTETMKVIHDLGDQH